MPSSSTLSHRDLCYAVTAWLQEQPSIDLTCWELRYNRGVVDVIGASIRSKKIKILEVKKTRSDLLADLNSKKLIKYEAKSTHCYLAATTEAFMLGKQTPTECLTQLTMKGLPVHWGVLLINVDGSVKCLRPARQHKKLHQVTIDKAIKQMGRAHMFRHMKLLNIGKYFKRLRLD